MKIGTLIYIDGKTQKGKNRIRRGGRAWMIKRVNGDSILLDSIEKRNELFWMKIQNDPHNRRLNDC